MVLTFIIPVFNAAEHIERCYTSLLPLVGLEIEIIFINDGSTDDSVDLLNELSKDDIRIRVISQVNQGAAVARNTGIKAAIGKYLFFLDSDDGIDSQALRPVLELAEKEQTDILGFMGEVRNEDDQIVNKTFKHPIPYNKIINGKIALVSGFQPSSACFFLYKTEFLKKNSLLFLEGINEEDVEFTARMFIPAQRVLFVETVVYYYYRNASSVTTTKDKKKVKHYLKSVAKVADAIMQNIYNTEDNDLKIAIEKNANSVVWNLLWRFQKNKNEVDYKFKLECIKILKEKKLYPIKGASKTKFQRLTSIFFNNERLLKILIK